MKKLYTSSSYLLFGVLLCLSCTSRSGSAVAEKSSRVSELPFFDEATFTPRWVSSTDLTGDFHAIPPFKLVNQHGEEVTEMHLDGKVTVVDFFFTVCPGICPKMMHHMAMVQEAFPEDSEVVMLSHSVTPEYDSVPILKDYAVNKGITKQEWHLLTGDREVIYNLGRSQYFIEEDLGLEKNPEDFIHTENFVLIDQQRRIRGIYNGLNKSSVRQLIADIKTLKDS